MKHNRTLRRGLSILLSLLLCLSLLPAAALADETPSASADFVEDADAALALLRNGDVSTADWDGDKKILTLKGVNFTTTAGTAVNLPNGATIVLAEGTTNTIASVCEGEKYSYGIYVHSAGLTIEGSGQLTVTGGTADYSYGICARYAGDVTITGGTVTATGGKAGGAAAASMHTRS